ncbi:MAG: hypothetical protein K2X93_10305 [Candidatus Obscuribacterales bacterium]|nr:hypothetical protein [Candidatus Obscuribacterales bacterium]
MAHHDSVHNSPNETKSNHVVPSTVEGGESVDCSPDPSAQILDPNLIDFRPIPRDDMALFRERKVDAVDSAAV